MMLFGLVWCCNFLSPLLDILHNDVSHKVVVQRKKGLTQSEEGRQIVVENERYSISSIFSLVKTLRFLIICPLTMLTFRQWVDNFENWTCSNWKLLKTKKNMYKFWCIIFFSLSKAFRRLVVFVLHPLLSPHVVESRLLIEWNFRFIVSFVV